MRQEFQAARHLGRQINMEVEEARVQNARGSVSDLGPKTWCTVGRAEDTIESVPSQRLDVNSDQESDLDLPSVDVDCSGSLIVVVVTPSTTSESPIHYSTSRVTDTRR